MEIKLSGKYPPLVKRGNGAYMGTFRHRNETKVLWNELLIYYLLTIFGKKFLLFNLHLGRFANVIEWGRKIQGLKRGISYLSNLSKINFLSSYFLFQHGGLG